MTMPFESIEDFRTRATEDDCKALETYIKAQPNKQKAFPNEQYGFSYSAAAAELRNRGYLAETRKNKTAEPELNDDEEDDILIRHPSSDSERKKDTWNSHTFCIKDTTFARFQALVADNDDLYTKKLLIDAVIRRGLKDYGY